MIYDKLNGQTLAYVGDAYWSLLVRKYLIDKGYLPSIKLNSTKILKESLIQFLKENEGKDLSKIMK